jgi:hypothetical protein
MLDFHTISRRFKECDEYASIGVSPMAADGALGLGPVQSSCVELLFVDPGSRGFYEPQKER